MNSLGQAIRAARLAQNWSQPTLADQVPCHPSLVSRWETDTVEPDLAQLARLATILGSPELRAMLQARVLEQTYATLALVAGGAA